MTFPLFAPTLPGFIYNVVFVYVCVCVFHHISNPSGNTNLQTIDEFVATNWPKEKGVDKQTCHV